MTWTVKKQQGISGLLGLVFLLLAGFAGLVGMKVVPMYYDDYAVGKAVEAVSENPDLAAAARQDVREWLERALQTQTVELPESAVHIVTNRKEINISIDYERRVNLMFNIDLIVTFDHHRVFNR